ncbi:Bax inhibitor-1/YccA family protein [Streptomyces sp. NPDC048643]|uniref:Bax inhibitor-1/YccA family protein n=1 Tax=Streptomyces sp. NPDC048643 TaxID=3155637 RepID=UPI00343C3E57
MNSSNPVFSRRGFGRIDSAKRPQGPETFEDAAHGSLLTSAAERAERTEADTAPSTVMTIDDVVTRTALTLGTVILAAVLSWVFLPVDDANIGRSTGIAVGAALGALVLALAQAFKRRPSPPLILSYAALEGVFLGVISSITSTFISPGVVTQAVLGTLAVFAGVLIAYKKRWIRVTRRFYGFTTAAAGGFVLLMMADLLFSAFGAGNGLGFNSGGLGLVFGVIGIVLGACFLALDFKQVEDGIAGGAPREESWLAAFGLTMTLVWIYLEALRVLSILRSED